MSTESTAVTSLRSAEKTDQEALDDAIVADNIGVIATLSATLDEISGQDTLACSVAGAAFHKSLTAGQQTKWTALEKTNLLGGGVTADRRQLANARPALK